MALQDRPLFLLLVTGLMLGLYFPLGKLALAGGVDPLAWAMLISLVPGSILAVLALKQPGRDWKAGDIRFFFLAGLAAYVIPNILTFLVIPRIGSGLASLTFALSPVLTALLSLLLGVRPPRRSLLLGVASGFAGAALIALSRNGLQINGSSWWLLAAFLIPVSLACGNVYRTARWPVGMSPLRMAAGATLASGLLLTFIVLATGGWRGFHSLLAVPGLAILQVLVSLTQFLVFFRLQWLGGPTYLSQIGYVAAAVGLAAGVAFMGETYPPLVWAGAAAIALGVAVSNWPERARTTPPR